MTLCGLNMIAYPPTAAKRSEWKRSETWLLSCQHMFFDLGLSGAERADGWMKTERRKDERGREPCRSGRFPGC